jgi:2,4-dienoyl-CoA reductase-like NADH-dependent reductase (Old Yellow Enzyme family)
MDFGRRHAQDGATTTLSRRPALSKLFSPLTLRGLTLKNRAIVSPMCQYSADGGIASDYHLVHLGRFALGGFGTVMVEATAVSPEGRITAGDMGIWSQDHVAPLARIAAFLRDNGAAPAIQLAHAGRKGSSRRPWRGAGAIDDTDRIEIGDEPWSTVAPTAERHQDSYAVPEELDRAGIAKVADDFEAAAGRALEAGFDIVEVHCAHGYLLNQFLSPISNKRSDQFGGAFENRARLPLDIVGRVRRLWPQDKPVFVRISAIDGLEGGWTIEDSVAFARQLRELGVDVVDCSSGGFSGARFPVGPLYQTPHAATVRSGAGIATMAVGLISQPEEAEAIVADGQADLVAFAREALVDPNWALRARHTLDGGEEAFADWPIQSGYAVRAQAKILGEPVARR